MLIYEYFYYLSKSIWVFSFNYLLFFIGYLQMRCRIWYFQKYLHKIGALVQRCAYYRREDLKPPTLVSVFWNAAWFHCSSSLTIMIPCSSDANISSDRESVRENGEPLIQKYPFWSDQTTFGLLPELEHPPTLSTNFSRACATEIFFLTWSRRRFPGRLSRLFVIVDLLNKLIATITQLNEHLDRQYYWLHFYIQLTRKKIPSRKILN